MSAKIPTIVRPLKSFAMIHKRGWIDPLDNPTLLLLLLYFYFFFFLFDFFFFASKKNIYSPLAGRVRHGMNCFKLWNSHGQPRWKPRHQDGGSLVGNGGGNLGEPRTIIVAVVGPTACDSIARCDQKLKKKWEEGGGNARREARNRIHSPTIRCYK